MHEGFHIALVTGPFHHLLHILPHAPVGVKIPLHVRPGLRHGYADVLCQGEGGNTVHDTEINRLGAGAHLRCHLGRVHMEHLRRREGVEILPGQKCLPHHLIPGHMGQEPQLHLGVVRVHQYMTRRRHEHAPDPAAHLRPGGNILQVRLRGGQTPCGRHRHLEAGTDAAVGVNDLQQAVGVGAFQLGVLSVLQNIRHDGRLPAQLLQHIGVGGPAGFGLFPMGQLHFFKQHRAQLLRRIDVKLLAGGLVNTLFQLFNFFGHVLSEGRQSRAVHQKAPALHPGQHGAQGQLHGLVQLCHVLFPELFRQNIIQCRHGGAVAVQRRPGGGGIPKGGKGVPLQMGGLGQFLVEIGHEQSGQIIAAGGGVQQIRRQSRVKHESIYGQILLQKSTHHVFYIMAHLANIGREQGRKQGVPVTGIGVLLQLRRHGGVLPGVPLDRQYRQIRQGIHGDCFRLPPLGKHGLRTVPISDSLHRHGTARLFLCGTRRRKVIFINELGELQLQKQIIKLRLKGPAKVVFGAKLHGYICDDGGQPVAVPGALLSLRQLADYCRLGVDVRQELVDFLYGAVLLYQRHGSLFPHPRYAGNVVGGIAHEGLQVDHMNGGKAVGLPEGLRGHVLGGGLAHACGHQLHLGVVSDELQAVLVPGDSHTVPARRLTTAADGTDEVICLPAGHLVAGNGHGIQYILQNRHLHCQFLGHTVAGGLVILVCLMAEGGLTTVKGHAQGIGLFFVQQPLQGGDESVHRMGIQPLPGAQGADAVKRAVDDAVAVQNHQLHALILRK